MFHSHFDLAKDIFFAFTFLDSLHAAVLVREFSFVVSSYIAAVFTSCFYGSCWEENEKEVLFIESENLDKRNLFEQR